MRYNKKLSYVGFSLKDDINLLNEAKVAGDTNLSQIWTYFCVLQLEDYIFTGDP